jgi:hypothetical protein
MYERGARETDSPHPDRAHERPRRTGRLSRIGPHMTNAQDFAEVGPPFGKSDFVYLVHDDSSKSVLSFQQSKAWEGSAFSDD